MLSCRRADDSVAALLDEHADLMVLTGATRSVPVPGGRSAFR